jgi:hypothetical protein
MNSSSYNFLLNSHALIEFSIDGHILWANQNFLNLMGYELEEVVGKPHTFFLPEHDKHQTEYNEMWSLLCQGQVQTGEFKRIAKNKSHLWLHGSYNPIKNDNGEIYKILKMVIDITEKKHLAKNLELKNRELQIAFTKARAATQANSAFLANMSHEIRTPLNSIIGITDTLAETPLDLHQQSFVEILQRANNQLMTIINDVLDLTKIESGEIQLKFLPFDLRKVLDDVVSVLGFRAQEKGLILDVSINPEIENFYVGDADRLRQVLINLVTNSIKFTHKGHITVRIEKNHTEHNGNLLFVVSDSGIGIPKSKHEDIFRAFTQADSTTTRRYGGTGLGLSISQKIVELMKGELWLTSTLGTGSVFSFTASMAETTERNTKMHNPLQGHFQLNEQTPYSASTILNILIVDDVEDNRNLFGIYLRKTTHNIYFAENGSEALRLIEKNAFDVIFMDIQMPGMDGHQTTMLARKLEKLAQRKPAKIFACTANAFNEDIEKSLLAGCDLHLSKPIRKDSLINLINSCSSIQPELVC